MDGYIGRLIEQRRAQPPRDDFFGILLGGGGHHPPLSRKALLDESLTMLLVGHETAVAALAWTLYLLAGHPHEADTLAADLVELACAALTIAQLDRLPRLREPPWTNRCGWSAGPSSGAHGCRACRRGRPSSAVGAEVVMPQWAVHRSSRWYDEPDRFIPARWTAEFRHTLPKFAYFPFAGGPRACVGSHFFWFESGDPCGVLAQRFRFSPQDPTPVVPYEGVTLLPTGSTLRLGIDRRTQLSSPVLTMDLVPHPTRRSTCWMRLALRLDGAGTEEPWLLGSARALTANGLAFFERCEQTAGIVQTRFATKALYVVTDLTAIEDVLCTHPQPPRSRSCSER